MEQHTSDIAAANAANTAEKIDQSEACRAVESLDLRPDNPKGIGIGKDMDQASVNEDRRHEPEPFAALAKQLIGFRAEGDEGGRINAEHQILDEVAPCNDCHHDVDQQVGDENRISQRSRAREVRSSEPLLGARLIVGDECL